MATSKSRRRFRAGLTAGLALAALAALGLGACGGDDDPLVIKRGEEAKRPPELDWGKPAGPFAGKPPRGVLMLLHGGGWRRNPEGYEEMRQVAPLYASGGYATLVVGYGPGAAGFDDVRQAYDKARQRYPKTPICVLGASAGGHLGLMLATVEPDLACVVDLAGPTNLTSLVSQDAGKAYQLAEDAFGENRFEKFSPIEDAGKINARVLMVFAETDPIVPEEQGEEFAEAMPDAELIVLPEGEDSFIHGPGVDTEAKQAANNRQTQFLAEATAPGA